MGKPKAVAVQTVAAEPKRGSAKVLGIIVAIFGFFARPVGLFAAAVGLFAAAVGLLNEWPRPTIEVTNAPEASNPFSAIFKVANTRFYPLDDVRIQAYLWCAKIGRGTDTTPPTMCKRGMASSE
jgi:hypothetical protein